MLRKAIKSVDGEVVEAVVVVVVVVVVGGTAAGNAVVVVIAVVVEAPEVDVVVDEEVSDAFVVTTDVETLEAVLESFLHDNPVLSPFPSKELPPAAPEFLRLLKCCSNAEDDMEDAGADEDKSLVGGSEPDGISCCCDEPVSRIGRVVDDDDDGGGGGGDDNGSGLDIPPPFASPSPSAPLEAVEALRKL